MKQTYWLEDIRLLNWHLLKNMMGVVLLTLYFICVHIGMDLRLAILAGHIISAAQRLYGVTEFFYSALADGVGALLSRIRPKRLVIRTETPQDWLPGSS